MKDNRPLPKLRPSDIRAAYSAGFKAGQESMRERAAKWMEDNESSLSSTFAEDIRALPIVEGA